MNFRFLIDECLSPELAQMAIQAGYVESTCVRDRGLSGTKDWKLIEYVIAGDFTLVTHNAIDFRGAGPAAPGGLHSRQAVHAGLVCLSSVHAMDLQRQRDLFQIVLDELGALSDLVNQALEACEQEDGSVEVVIYALPDAP